MNPGLQRAPRRPALLSAAAGCCIAVAGAWAQGLPPVSESQPIATQGGGAPPRGEAAALPLPERVARLERLLESQALLDMLMRLDQLQKDMQELRGAAETQAHEFEGIKQRQRELYLDIDRRIHQIEVALTQRPAAAPEIPKSPGAVPGAATPALSGTIAPPAVTAAPVAPAPGVAEQVAPQGDPLREQAAYQKAFDALKDSRYDEAIGAFNQYLMVYPGGQFAANAQYWIGEANYVARQFAAAAEEFNKVLVNYPGSAKTADAMLKLGYTYYELQEWQQARRVLDDLVARFPQTTAAQLAQNRLHRMKLEGR